MTSPLPTRHLSLRSNLDPVKYLAQIHYKTIFSPKPFVSMRNFKVHIDEKK